MPPGKAGDSQSCLRQEFVPVHQVRYQPPQFFAVVEQALDAGEQVVRNASVDRLDAVDVAQADAELAADLAGIPAGANLAGCANAVQVEQDLLHTLATGNVTKRIIDGARREFLPSFCSLL